MQCVGAVAGTVNGVSRAILFLGSSDESCLFAVSVASLRTASCTCSGSWQLLLFLKLAKFLAGAITTDSLYCSQLKWDRWYFCNFL